MSDEMTPLGPSGDQFPAFQADPFGYLRDLEQYGAIVGIDLGGIPTAVVYDLDAIDTIFKDHLEHIGRAAVFDRLSHATGNGILTNYDWSTWRPRRSVVGVPLRARAVSHFSDRMVHIIEQELEGWPVDTPFDLYENLRVVTLRVVADLLFSSDIDATSIDTIATAVAEIHKWAEADPSNADLEHEPETFRVAINALHALIDEIVATRTSETPGDDMIGVLLTAQQDGLASLDATGIRDEAVTLILAGHDTVTNALSFAVDLLGRNPGARHHHPRHIVDETLRLYPPVHLTAKAIMLDLQLGNVVIPSGWEVLIPEWTIYRDERYFERPDEFLPERWTDTGTLLADRNAYFPFLTGPKFCVGSHFALLEATTFISLFLDRFDHEMLDPVPPRTRPFALSFGPAHELPILLRQNAIRP